MAHRRQPRRRQAALAAALSAALPAIALTGCPSLPWAPEAKAPSVRAESSEASEASAGTPAAPPRRPREVLVEIDGIGDPGIDGWGDPLASPPLPDAAPGPRGGAPGTPGIQETREIAMQRHADLPPGPRPLPEPPLPEPEPVRAMDMQPEGRKAERHAQILKSQGPAPASGPLSGSPAETALSQEPAQDPETELPRAGAETSLPAAPPTALAIPEDMEALPLPLPLPLPNADMQPRRDGEAEEAGETPGAPAEGLSPVEGPKATAAMQEPPSGDAAPADGHDPLRRSWTIRSGWTLRETISAWGQKAGWAVSFQTRNDWPIKAGATVEGTFLDAARFLAEGFRRRSPSPSLTAYLRNRVLVVKDDGH